MRSLIAAVTAVALAAARVASAEPLDQHLAELVRTNPQVLAAEKAVASAGEGIRAARAGYLPSLRLKGDAGPEHIDAPSRRDAGQPSWMRGRDTLGATLTQNLFNGWGTDAAVGSASASRDVSAQTLRSVRQNVILEGVAAYLDVLRQQQLVKLGSDNEQNIRGQLQLEDERVRRGSGVAVDVLQAKQRLQIAKERRVAYEGALLDAMTRFQQVFGYLPETSSMVEPQPPVESLPPSLADAVAIAGKENPSVVSSAKTIDLNRQKRRAAGSGYFPTIDLVGASNYEHHKNLVPGVRRDWSVLVQLNWELFSGFRTDATVAQASLDLAASQDTHAHSNRKAQEQARLAWQAMMTARERLGLLENAVNLAYEVWEARRKQREAGKVTVMDVLDAESAIYTASIAYADASYDMRQAVYQLLHAMGRLELDSITRAKP